jgi:hypothetical protein
LITNKPAEKVENIVSSNPKSHKIKNRTEKLTKLNKTRTCKTIKNTTQTSELNNKETWNNREQKKQNQSTKKPTKHKIRTQ